MEQGSSSNGDDETDGMISYEMADKRIRNDDDVLYEVNLSEEQHYMLDHEHAISEDDDDTDDGDQEKSSAGSDSLNSRQSYGAKEEDVGLDMPHLVSDIKC